MKHAIAAVLSLLLIGGGAASATGTAGADPASLLGRTVYRVTSLADSGPGTLRELINTTAGPRDIVFDVGGIIELGSTLVVRKGDVRILGETAPSPGITLRGAMLEIKRGRVSISHLAIRVGPGAPGKNVDNRDGIAISGAPGSTNCKRRRDVGHIVLDHVSVTWAVDENIQLWGCNIHRVTISNSIIAEALDDAGHSKGPHSMGLIIGIGTRDVLVYRNLFVSNRRRNPVVAAGASAAIINNVIHNPGANAIHIYPNRNRRPSKLSVVANLVIGGPSSGNHLKLGNKPGNSVNPGTEIFMFANLVEGEISTFNVREVTNLRQVRVPPVEWPEDLRIVGTFQLEKDLLRRVGPKYRDATDRRLIDEVRRRTGSIKDTPPANEWRPASPEAAPAN